MSRQVMIVMVFAIVAFFGLITLDSWNTSQAKIACIENGGEVRSGLGARWECRRGENNGL